MPLQRINDEIALNNTLNSVNYIVLENGFRKEITAKLKQRKEKRYIEEVRVQIQKPLEEFEILYPEELESRNYIFKSDKRKQIYIFSDSGKDKARMEYLYDGKGEKNFLPKKNLWILLQEDYDIELKKEIVDERYYWNSYKLFSLDLQGVEKLKVKNKIDNTEDEFPTSSTFQFQGNIIEDDFKIRYPLFIGNCLKLIAPSENIEGWNVWLQNSNGDYVLKENWYGKEPLYFNSPDDFPSGYGEYQIDICSINSRVPDEVMFFRYLPYLQLSFPKELIFPETNTGHKTEIIKLNLPEKKGWELKTQTNEYLKKNSDENIEINIPPNIDEISFSINKQNEPDNSVNCKVTIPRIKWRTSKQKNWISILQNMKRDDLIYGETLNICIKTSDSTKLYTILGIIEFEGFKIQERFKRNQSIYVIDLNRFLDTILTHLNKLTFKIEIYDNENNSFIKSIDVIHFKDEQEKKKKIKAIVKCSGRFGFNVRIGKGFSKTEAKKAHLSQTDMKKLNVAFDKRRKSTYDENIKILKRLKSN